MLAATCRGSVRSTGGRSGLAGQERAATLTDHGSWLAPEKLSRRVTMLAAVAAAQKVLNAPLHGRDPEQCAEGGEVDEARGPAIDEPNPGHTCGPGQRDDKQTRKAVGRGTR